MHKQQYKHPLDTILNNIQETQDKLLVVFFHGRGELLKKNIRYIIDKSIQKKNWAEATDRQCNWAGQASPKIEKS